MAYYLYNGVELPDIYSVYTPEVQKTHPYAYVFSGILGHSLYASPIPLYRTVYIRDDTTEEYGASITALGRPEGQLISWSTYYTPDEWSNMRESPLATFGPATEYLIWSKTDVMCAEAHTPDGSLNFEYIQTDELFMKGSAPIPVGGTSEPIDPTSMLLGFQVGQAIRRNRK